MNKRKKRLKIGIICTKPSSEKKKDELLNVRSTNRWWLKGILKDPKLKVHCIYNDKKQCCVAGDVSVGMYIRENYKNIDVDIIPFKEIDSKRLNQNDINFMLIYDILEAFHNLKYKSLYLKIKKALLTSKKVYPPASFQNFVNRKDKYITYLNKKKVNTIPTITISHKQALEKGISTKILNRVKQQKWNKFIAKPLFGQESIGFKSFTPITDNNEAKILKELDKYINMYKNMNKSKPEHLPGFIIQKYIEGFDKKNPEIRMYYIDSEYQYSIITTDNKVMIPSTENGTCKISNKTFEELKQYSKSVLNKLPKIKYKGKVVPKLLIRIDIACQKQFEKDWVVNEIEFVPSLYIEDISKIPEPKLGDTIVKIAKKIVFK